MIYMFTLHYPADDQASGDIFQWVRSGENHPTRLDGVGTHRNAICRFTRWQLPVFRSSETSLALSKKHRLTHLAIDTFHRVVVLVVNLAIILTACGWLMLPAVSYCRSDAAG